MMFIPELIDVQAERYKACREEIERREREQDYPHCPRCGKKAASMTIVSLREVDDDGYAYEYPYVQFHCETYVPSTVPSKKDGAKDEYEIWSSAWINKNGEPTITSSSLCQ